MQNFYIFLLILFFGKSVLLTPVPVDVIGNHEIIMKTPLNVVTSEPHVSINVTASLKTKFKREIDLSAFETEFYALVPKDGIEVSLFEKNGEITKFTRISFAQNAEVDYLILSSQAGVSTDKKFVKMVITSKAPLKKVLIEWSNYTY